MSGVPTTKVVVTGIPRPPIGLLDELARFGVATVHEALGRVGYLGPDIRPIQRERGSPDPPSPPCAGRATI